MPELSYVRITDVVLWNENPRNEPSENENEAIVKIINEQQLKNRNKLLPLAKHMIEYGIFEPLGILKCKNNIMIVKEGNRRAACLKMLKNPNLIPPGFEPLQKAFVNLSKKAPKTLFNKIPARIFSEEEDEYLEEWIDLRHKGLQEGQGLNSWNANQIEKRRYQRGENTPLLKLQLSLVENNILTQEEIASVHKTNWERILLKTGQEWLGITRKNSEYVYDKDSQEFKKRMKMLIHELDGQSVGILYDREAQFMFYANLDKKMEESCTGSRTQKTDTNSTLHAPINIEDHTSEISEQDTHSNKRHTAKPSKFLENLKCNLKNDKDTEGIICIVDELRNLSKTYHYKNYPIAVAMLLRSLLEQSLKLYLKRNNKWNKLAGKYSNRDPLLSEILDYFEKDTSLLSADNKLKRFFDVAELKHCKDYFDCVIHHPSDVGVHYSKLESIVKTGYLAVIQHIIIE